MKAKLVGILQRPRSGTTGDHPFALTALQRCDDFASHHGQATGSVRTFIVGFVPATQMKLPMAN